jgi:hypothetical protein
LAVFADFAISRRSLATNVFPFKSITAHHSGYAHGLEKNQLQKIADRSQCTESKSRLAAMSMEDLTIYLNDHLAGSVSAIELVDHLIETYKGKSLEPFLTNLRNEIDADQRALQDLIKKLGVKESAVRKAGAWVAEKLARMKVRVSDSEKDQMGLLDALEGLLLGITGKGALWSALEAASENVPSLRGLGYARLQQRAREQCDLVDAKRLESAREVFKPEK